MEAVGRTVAGTGGHEKDYGHGAPQHSEVVRRHSKE